MKQKITVRLEPGDIVRLGEVAEAAGVSRGELLRTMVAGSRLRDVRVHRGYNRELLYALHQITMELRRVAEHADERKLLDLTILQRLDQIRESLFQLYRTQTWGRDDC